MPVSKHLQDQLTRLRALPPMEELLADREGAASYTEAVAEPTGWSVRGVATEDLAVPAADGAVHVRQYRPADGLPDTAPTLVWVHGGGFVSGDLSMNEANMVAAEVAARTPARVLSVDYRLAVGGLHFPAPLDDVSAVLDWAIRQYGDTSSVAIGGASAGANLAASAAVRTVARAGHTPSGLVLAYPFMHFPVPSLDAAMAAEMAASVPPVLRFSAGMVELMTAAYVGRITEIPAAAMPGNAALCGLPKTLVVICEYDDLRPSAELFVRQLRASGIEVDTWFVEGMIHGFLDRTPALPEVDRALDLIASTLNSLRQPTGHA